MTWQDDTYSPLDENSLSSADQEMIRELLGIIWEASAGSFATIAGTAAKVELGELLTLGATLTSIEADLGLDATTDSLLYIPYHSGLPGSHLLALTRTDLVTLGAAMNHDADPADPEAFDTIAAAAAELLNQLFKVANENLTSVFGLNVDTLSPVVIAGQFSTLDALYDEDMMASPLVGQRITLTVDGKALNILNLVPQDMLTAWLAALQSSVEGEPASGAAPPPPAEPEVAAAPVSTEGAAVAAKRDADALSNDEIDALFRELNAGTPLEAMAGPPAAPPPAAAAPAPPPVPSLGSDPMAGAYPPPPPAANQPPVKVQPVAFQQFQDGPQRSADIKNLDLLLDIPLELRVQLGKTDLPLKQVLDLAKGSIIELDRVAGEPVDLLANDRLVARGEVVVIEDNFGIRITQIVSPLERLRSL